MSPRSRRRRPHPLLTVIPALLASCVAPDPPPAPVAPDASSSAPAPTVAEAPSIRAEPGAPPVDAPAASPESPRPRELAELVTRERLEAHVRYLASDELEGRETGSEGARLAAEYLASALEEAGVEPGGADGAYFQPVPIHSLVFDDVPRVVGTTVRMREEEFRYGVHFSGWRGAPPEKTLAVHVVRSAMDAPHESRPDLALYVDGNGRQRAEWVDRTLAWGALIRPGSKDDGSEAETTPPRESRWVGGDGPPTASFAAHGALREALERGTVTELRVEAATRLVELPARNVVGVLPGRGELAPETVVYTAHFDHVGMREPPIDDGGDDGADDGTDGEPDLVYNGADDDASGCAAVLEIARALAADARANPDVPARTQVFLLVTGEEMGLLGTDHYLENPVRPLAETVCNLNFEMIGRPDDAVGGAGRLWLTGFERTSLGEAFRAAGLALMPDPRLDQHFFERSDNYAFAKRGIVAQTLSSYAMHEDYHRVTDEADTLDYAHLEAAVRAAFLGARALANGEVTPAWKPGGRPD